MDAPVPTPRDANAWTTRRLLRWMNEEFQKRGIDAPRLVAEMLLAHVIGCERLRLYMDADRPASVDERDRLRELVRRTLADEPVQYLLGEALFYGLQFEVTPATLIPRPCTEMLVEHAVRSARASVGGDGVRIADIGTGTGCIAVACARALPEVRIIATDIAQEILDLAARNARRHNVDAVIEFRCGEGCEPLAAEHEPFDIIVSNPPYIPDNEWNDPAMVGANVKGHEPERALRGGADGLDVVRPLISDAANHLRPGGVLLIEISDSQHEQVHASAAGSAAYDEIEILRDDEGFRRMLRAIRR